MAEKPWKRTERRVAVLLGGTRAPVSGRQRGDRPDIEHETLSLEVKHRQSVPAWLLDALAQAEASSTDGKLPVAVLHADGKPYADSLVLVKLSDFADYLQRGEGID